MYIVHNFLEIRVYTISRTIVVYQGSNNRITTSTHVFDTFSDNSCGMSLHVIGVLCSYFCLTGKLINLLLKSKLIIISINFEISFKLFPPLLVDNWSPRGQHLSPSSISVDNKGVLPKTIVWCI